MIESRQDFSFEVAFVNERGDIIRTTLHRAQRFVEVLPGNVPLAMVAIPAGRFLMGSRPNEGYDDERPQHSVNVPAFFMSQYPVTQAQWTAVMKWIPPYRCEGPQRPVDRVNWHNAVEFCARLSEATGRTYRLPSEAEWEYTCRANTTTPFYCGPTITTDQANYVGLHIYLAEPEGLYRHVTTDVGSFPPNAFGLYDMHGNVWEWCTDTWHDNYTGAPIDGCVWTGGDTAYRVLRGGCWHDPPGLCRSAARLKYAPNEGEDYFGFRAALTSLEMTPVDQTRRHTLTKPILQFTRRVKKWFHQ